PVDQDPQDNPSIRRITLTPEPAPGVTVAITLDAFDPRHRLSEQILALNARTGDAFVMESPEPPRWGRPLEGKLYPNGLFGATYGHPPRGSRVEAWTSVLPTEDCSTGRNARAPFRRGGSPGTAVEQLVRRAVTVAPIGAAGGRTECLSVHPVPGGV